MKIAVFIFVIILFCTTAVFTQEKEKFEDILQKASSGDPAYQYKAAMGYMFDKQKTKENKERSPDYKSAFFWLSKSAQKGHMESQYLLSMLYEYGKGTKKDYERAIYWYKKAVQNEKENAAYLTKSVNEFVKEKELPEKLRPPKKHLHEPFKIGACVVCHAKRDAGYGKLIIDDINTLCHRCHEKKEVHGFVHEPLKNGRCTECHDPHQSDTKMLLKGADVNDLCLKCHDKKRKPNSIRAFIEFDKTNRHKPAQESCLKCHKAHSSDHEKLLSSDDGKSSQCLECHKDIKAKINGAHYKHGPVQNSKNRCLECHDVHASDNKKLLHKELIPLCLDCHDKPIVADEDGRVLINIAEQLDRHPNWHKPIKKDGCIICHDPHGSDNFCMLKSPFEESFKKEDVPIKGRLNKKFYEDFDKEDFLCFKCHKNNKIDERINLETNFRDGSVNLHFIHVNYKKGRACKVCHDEHASKYRHLIRDDTVFGDAAFPIRHIATENGGSCAPACHKKAEYDRIEPKGIGIIAKEIKK